MTNFICDMLKSPLVVWNETLYKIVSVPFWDLSVFVTLAFYLISLFSGRDIVRFTAVDSLYLSS